MGSGFFIIRGDEIFKNWSNFKILGLEDFKEGVKGKYSGEKDIKGIIL